jgi:hypothetical protein
MSDPITAEVTVPGLSADTTVTLNLKALLATEGGRRRRAKKSKKRANKRSGRSRSRSRSRK